MGFWDGVFNVVSAIPVAITKALKSPWFPASAPSLVLSALSGGFMIGGPSGAVTGGAAGAAVGGLIERKINGQDLDLSVSKLEGDAVFGGITSMLGGGTTTGLIKGAGQATVSSAAKITIFESGGQIMK
ncbi:hypothetical protein MMC26_004984 [Xylographa opegraphella]|nr:hypothetical protein [Xylographa opegraphella]